MKSIVTTGRSAFSRIFGRPKHLVQPRPKVEDICLKQSYNIRRQQIQSLVQSQSVEQVHEFIREIAEQAYIAGLNRLDLNDTKLQLVGYTGYKAILVKGYLKDKGLC